jgi:DNA-binding protein H-NS
LTFYFFHLTAIFNFRHSFLKGVILKIMKELSDRDLILAAREIEAESKLRANRRAAASAILTILKKHKLSVSDLPDLDLGQHGKARTGKKSAAKRGRLSKPKVITGKKNDQRAKVAFKYKNPQGSGNWSGRGRAPKWVEEILKKRNISLIQFKSDRRYKI